MANKNSQRVCRVVLDTSGGEKSSVVSLPEESTFFYHNQRRIERASSRVTRSAEEMKKTAEPIPWLLFAGGGILFVSAVLSSPYLALVGLATGLYAEYIQSIDNKKDLDKSVLNALLG